QPSYFNPNFTLPYGARPVVQFKSAIVLQSKLGLRSAGKISGLLKTGSYFNPKFAGRTRSPTNVPQSKLAESEYNQGRRSIQHPPYFKENLAYFNPIIFWLKHLKCAVCTIRDSSKHVFGFASTARCCAVVRCVRINFHFAGQTHVEPKG